MLVLYVLVFAFSVLYGALVFLSSLDIGLAVLKDGGVILLAGAAMTTVLIRTRISMVRSWWVLAGFVVSLFSLCVLGILVGMSNGANLSSALLGARYYFLYPAICLVPAIAIRKREDTQRIIDIVLEIGVWSAAFGIVAYFIPSLQVAPDIVLHRTGLTQNAVVGTLGNRPNMGMFCVLIFALSYSARGLLFGAHRTAVQGVLIVAVLLTFSRTAYIGLLAVIISSMWMRQMRGNAFRLAMTGSATAVIALLYLDLDVSILNAIQAMDITLSGRTALWANILDGLPVYGRGLGRYGVVTQLSTSAATLGAVDNAYLKSAAELGVGSLAFVGLMLFSVTELVTRSRSDNLLFGFTLQIIAIVVMGMTVDWLHVAPVALMSWWAVGMAAVSCWRFNQADGSSSSQSSDGRVAASAPST